MHHLRYSEVDPLEPQLLLSISSSEDQTAATSSLQLALVLIRIILALEVSLETAQRNFSYY